jgi:hypothetical protein
VWHKSSHGSKHINYLRVKWFMQLLQTWDKLWIDLNSCCYVHNLEMSITWIMISAAVSGEQKEKSKQVVTTYSGKCIIWGLWPIHMVIRVYKLLTTLMPKNLSRPICNYLKWKRYHKKYGTPYKDKMNSQQCWWVKNRNKFSHPTVWTVK